MLCFGMKIQKTMEDNTKPGTQPIDLELDNKKKKDNQIQKLNILKIPKINTRNQENFKSKKEITNYIQK